MITVNDLTYNVAGRELFRKAAFTIDAGCHCALIGANGTGKTTLIDLLLHPSDYLYKGSVTVDAGLNTGYVNQFVEHQKDRALTVFEYLSEDFEKLQERMDILCEQLGNTDDDGTVMDAYQTVLDKFTALDGYNYEINILRQLKTAELEQIQDISLADISGGEYKLVQIIRQMLLLPDLLVMDEPDVFLDFENLKGLKDLINSYEGTMLVATHNRYLLNHCFNKVLQIEDHCVREFDGSYVDFCFTQLQMKIAMEELSQKESAFISFEEAVVERMRDDASKYPDLKKGRTLHARVSYLERWKVRHISEPYIESRMPVIRFPEVSEDAEATPADTSARGSSERPVVTVSNYSITFDDSDAPILKNVSFTIRAGEKVALVGANGTGKTTLLRDIWNNNDPAISIASDISVEFLSQFQGETLDESRTVWQMMSSLGFVNEQSAAEYLSAYCLAEELLYRPVRTLSGGEKNLLQLSRLGSGKAVFLLLDEPTSHLDLYAQKALEKAIAEYKGSVLMVSHDFYTVTGCMDRILLAENGTIRSMSGRAFRKMIYRRHFSRSYLEMEQKKTELEAQINAALRSSDYESAKRLCAVLSPVVEALLPGK